MLEPEVVHPVSALTSKLPPVIAVVVGVEAAELDPTCAEYVPDFFAVDEFELSHPLVVHPDNPVVSNPPLLMGEVEPL